MEIAVLADIHGNTEALRTCVSYAAKRGIREFLLLGDYLGELAFPQRTMEYLYQMKKKYQCIFVRGNKEDYWLNHQAWEENSWKPNTSTTGALYYTYHALRVQDLNFFSSLNITETVQAEGMKAITICHGSPRRTNEGLRPGQENIREVLQDSPTDLILCGHTHVQGIARWEEKRIVNPGSVGMPLKSKGMTQFLILHQDGTDWNEEFISLPYDREQTIRNLYEAGLDKMAPYWCKTSIQILRTGEHSQSQILNRAMEYCRETEGNCSWPHIPEKYWDQAYKDFFGKE